MLSLELISQVTSHISVFGWVFAGSYQLYLGWLNNSVEGFSPFFLTGYVLGDIFNVLGCFWGRQMMFQKVIATCSLITDSLLAVQYVYFKRQARKLRNAQNTKRRNYLGVHAQNLRPVLSATMFAVSHALPTGAGSGNTLATVQESLVLADKDWEFLVGQLFSWIAEIFYVTAVIPQVVQVFKSKCTGGVSRLLFLADLIGSIGYVSTIIVEAQTLDTENDAVEFLIEKMAYLLGSSCCIVADLTLLVQYMIYPDFIDIDDIDGETTTGAQSSPFYGQNQPPSLDRLSFENMSRKQKEAYKQQACDSSYENQPMILRPLSPSGPVPVPGYGSLLDEEDHSGHTPAPPYFSR